AIAALGPFRLSGCPRGSLSRDRNGRRIQVIAFVLGDLDGGRPEEIIIRFASCLGGGTLDHLPADLKTDHPLLLLRVPVYGCIADFHHGTFLHEGLRDGLLLLVLSGDLRAEATVRFPAYAGTLTRSNTCQIAYRLQNGATTNGSGNAALEILA